MNETSKDGRFHIHFIHTSGDAPFLEWEVLDTATRKPVTKLSGSWSGRDEICKVVFSEDQNYVLGLNQDGQVMEKIALPLPLPDDPQGPKTKEE